MGADEKGIQMEVVTVPSYAELSLRAADVVCKAIRDKAWPRTGITHGRDALEECTDSLYWHISAGM